MSDLEYVFLYSNEIEREISIAKYSTVVDIINEHIIRTIVLNI